VHRLPAADEIAAFSADAAVVLRGALERETVAGRIPQRVTPTERALRAGSRQLAATPGTPFTPGALSTSMPTRRH
jgi:hypothetical protein